MSFDLSEWSFNRLVRWTDTIGRDKNEREPTILLVKRKSFTVGTAEAKIIGTLIKNKDIKMININNNNNDNNNT